MIVISGPNGDPIVERPNTPAETPSVEQFIQMIKDGLEGARTIAHTDKDKIFFLLGALQIPFNGAGLDTAKIFEPVFKSASPYSNPDFNAPIQNVISQISNSINNPLAGVLGSEGQQLNTSVADLSAFADQAANSDFDRAQLALRSFFLLGDNNEANLAGLLLYAIEESLPSVRTTQEYLRKLEDTVIQTLEGVSTLPNFPIPEIPNVVVVKNLCQAESQLNTALAELSRYQTLNRSAVASAAAHVCESADLIGTGVLPPESMGILKSMFGLTDLQASIMAQSRFSQDPGFPLKLKQIDTLNGFVGRNLRTIKALNQNIESLVETLSGLGTISIGSIMKIMISMILGRIQTLRVGLETQVVKFVRESGHTVAASLSGSSKAALLSSSPVDTSEMYISLSALCSVLQNVSNMYRNIIRVLTDNSPMLVAVKQFATLHTDKETSKCLDSDGLDVAIQHFLDTAAARSSGQTNSNDAVMQAGHELITRSRLVRQCLGTIAGSFQDGRKAMNRAFELNGGNITSSSATGDVADLIRFMPPLQAALRTLDLKRIVGGSNANAVEPEEYDALNLINNGIQGLAFYCDNEFVRNVSRLFQVVFKVELDRRRSVAVTEGSMDEVPAISWKANVNYRVEAIDKYLADLEKFISNPELAKSCAPVNNVTKSAPQVVAIEPSRIKPTISVTKNLTALGN